MVNRVSLGRIPIEPPSRRLEFGFGEGVLISVHSRYDGGEQHILKSHVGVKVDNNHSVVKGGEGALGGGLPAGVGPYQPRQWSVGYQRGHSRPASPIRLTGPESSEELSSGPIVTDACGIGQGSRIGSNVGSSRAGGML